MNFFFSIERAFLTMRVSIYYAGSFFRMEASNLSTPSNRRIIILLHAVH